MLMNFKRYIDNANHFTPRAFVLVVSFFITLSFTAFSNESKYQLVDIAQLEQESITEPSWHKLVANPSNKKQHFLIRESGQIHLVDEDEINPKAILDLRVFQQQNSSLFKLTAIELHPNFSLRDQIGYGTFYTAHIENFDENKKTKRLLGRGDEVKLNADAVITEWKFNAVNYQTVDVNAKREVLRVGVPDHSLVIKQISFNPYIKSWNEGFGLLYVALNGDKKWSSPLYSGVVLRINPEKYGLRSYRVPDSNPYMENNQIHDAIYVLGGQSIKQFLWPEKSSEQILISHHYDNKQLLSLSDGQNDWRSASPKKVLYQSSNTVQDMLIYQGRELLLMRSKLLLLRQNGSYWNIDSLAFYDTKYNRDQVKPQLVWRITTKKLAAESKIFLGRNHYGEVLLMERNTNALFRLAQQVSIIEKTAVAHHDENLTEEISSNRNVLILFIITVIIGVIYYWFIRRGDSVKRIVRQQFSLLEVSESGQQIGLYHRHQSDAEVIIDISNIVSSEIKLNEYSINVVNTEIGHGFNNDKDSSLRAIFANEKIDKMVDGKVRQISLLLTDNNKNKYPICLYMRKGSNRITKKSYTKVINELIDWCWLVSEKINSDNTDKRTVKAKVVTKETGSVNSSSGSSALLHKQVGDISPSVQVNNSSAPVESGVLSSTLKVVSEQSQTTDYVSEESHEMHNQVDQSSAINTELVNALEKLVNLKQEGFLTEDEFSKAKDNLLKDLFK